MPNIYHYSTTNLNNPHSKVAKSRLIMSTLILGSTLVVGLTGCGQKGALTLAEPSSQTVASGSEMLDSSSHPQDAAFATIDDDNYQKTRYLEQKQVLPDTNDDPNDYWYVFSL